VQLPGEPEKEKTALIGVSSGCFMQENKTTEIKKNCMIVFI
jgi:hypothetical protein